MLLGQLSGVGGGLLPQRRSVCRLGLVCFTNALPWRTSPLCLSTSAGLMMDHHPPSKRRKSADGKRSLKDGDAGSEFHSRDNGGPGEVLSSERSKSKDARLGNFSQEVVGQPPPPGTESALHQAPMRGWESLLARRWEASPACGAPWARRRKGGRALDFSVMSYNILSQELLQANSYLYPHCLPAALGWPHRLRNLLAELRHYDADVLCLQEVQEDHFENQIRPALHEQGYECVYKKRTGEKPDGCVVAFKTSRLSLLSSNPVEFFRPGDTLLDRDNVGLVLLLRPRGGADGDAVCVANTHLLYNPRRGDVKLAQLAILLAEIGRAARLPDGSAHPVLLCGDFNATPWSPLYAFLTGGRLDYRHLPIGTVSGQEYASRGQRLLENPIWSPALGINQRCQYESTCASSASGSAHDEPEISRLKVDDVARGEVAEGAVADKSWKSWHLEHGVRLRSCYGRRLAPDGRPAVTTCHSRCAMMVDYILYTPCDAADGGRGLRLLGRLALVGRPELEQVDGLPNERHSSDHLPLLARFRWIVGQRA